MEHLDWIAGTDTTYTITLRDSAGADLLNVYNGSETLSLVIWPGEDQPALALSASVATWDTPAVGTITLTLDRTDVLNPGLYWLRINLADGTALVPCYEAQLHVETGPGSATALPSYGTMADIYHYCPWMDTLIESTPNLRSDLGSQRARARQRIDDLILSRATDALTEQYIRHAPIATTDPIIPTTGVDAGPLFGPSTIPNTSLRDHINVIRGYLASNLLIVDDRLKEAAARLAVAFACEYQPGQSPMGSSYQDLGKSYAKAARSLLRGWVARIDTNADGIAEVEIP